MKLNEEDLYDLAEIFKIFGDSTRIRILYALFEKELCVADIAESLSMNQSAVSHQLRFLKTNRLVRSRRDGKQVFYSLDDERCIPLDINFLTDDKPLELDARTSRPTPQRYREHESTRFVHKVKRAIHPLVHVLELVRDAGHDMFQSTVRYQLVFN